MLYLSHVLLQKMQQLKSNEITHTYRHTILSHLCLTVFEQPHAQWSYIYAAPPRSTGDFAKQQHSKAAEQQSKA